MAAAATAPATAAAAASRGAAEARLLAGAVSREDRELPLRLRPSRSRGTAGSRRGGRAPRSATRSSCRRTRRSASRAQVTSAPVAHLTPGWCACASDGTYAFGGARYPPRNWSREMKTVTTIAELRRALGPLASGDDRARPDDGRAPRGPPRAVRGGAGRSATRSSRASSSTRRSSATRPTSPRYPRDLAADERAAEAAGVDLLFAPPADELYPPGFATWVVPGGRRGRPRGRGTARPLPRRRDRLPEALHDRPAGRRLLRPQGRPAGRGREAARPRPEPRARDPRRPDRPRRRRARALVAQRPALARGAAAGARDPARARDARSRPRPRDPRRGRDRARVRRRRRPRRPDARRRRPRRLDPPDRQRAAGRRHE